MEKAVLTKLKIRDTSVVIYPSYELFNLVRGKNPNSLENLKDGKVKGYLSANSARRVRDIVQAWTNCIKAKQRKSGGSIDKYISFITLTLPAKQFHTDLEIKRKALNPFLITIFRKFKVSAWLWKAEPQQNGNIHFHILVNRFCPWQKVRLIWNQIIGSLGYLDLFEKKHGHRNPNSTDIHGLYKDKKGNEISFVGAYMAKYMSKKNAGSEKLCRPISGRIWGCSDNLKSIAAFSDYEDSTFGNFLQDLIDSQEIETYSGEFFKVLMGNWRKACEKYPQILEKIDSHYLLEYEKTCFQQKTDR